MNSGLRKICILLLRCPGLKWFLKPFTRNRRTNRSILHLLKLKHKFMFADLLFRGENVYSLDKRGLRYCYDPSMINYIMLSDWEKTSVDFVEAFLNPGDVFIDVGAHVGHFTLPMAAKGVRVYAFEPHAMIGALLEKNVIENGLREAISFFPIALSDASGEARLTKNLFGGNRITSEKKDSSVIHTETLDRMVEDCDIRNVKLIKADIEGAELRMLKGAEQTLEKHSPALLLEIDARHLQNFGATPTALFEYLKQKGYVCKKAFEDHAVIDTCDYIHEGSTRNYLFEKSSVSG